MKEDEIKFFKTMVRYCRCYYADGSYYERMFPRQIINILGEFMNYKRCCYLLEKWTRLGFYDWGICLDLGWLEMDKLPDRYKVLLED